MFNGKPVQVYNSDAPVSSGNPFPVTVGALAPSSGRSKVAILRNNNSSTNITSAAYVQLTASTGALINKLQIFLSSDASLYLAVGAGGAEIDQIYIFPGGNGDVELTIAAGSRISVKAVSTSATSGELLINCLS